MTDGKGQGAGQELGQELHPEPPVWLPWGLRARSPPGPKPPPLPWPPIAARPAEPWDQLPFLLRFGPEIG